MSDRNALARFMEEYALVERIQSRHVARIYTHGASEGHAYLVMEFFEGGDLNKRLGGKALPAEEAVRLFRDLMFALGDIHEKGILHRDLKPQNLMFRTDGSLAVVDFGDRKSTRLNSSHQIISYAVFCLKKKKKKNSNIQ